MSTALVTGGCGFLGRHLVSALHARGDRVSILDLAPPEGLPGDVAFARGSILDPAALGKAMAQIDFVYHLAGIAKLWVRHKSEFDWVNVRGTDTVLRVASEHGVKRIVHCSTEAILLPKDRARNAQIDESVLPPYRDMPGPYTRSKHRAEQLVLAAVQQGQDIVVVNPTVPVGADDRNLTPPAAMLSMFLAGSSPAFLDCMLNLVDVRDVAAGMILAAERGRAGERYILGGENVSLRDLLGRLEAISARPMPKRAIPAPVAVAAAAMSEWIADYVTKRVPAATREGVQLALRSAPFDSSKARRDLGYASRPAQEALEAAVRWLRSVPR
ncbi:MAG: NAD-dependent epimerase/dehydratase family protein [Xanthobacteraceae bacterium]